MADNPPRLGAFPYVVAGASFMPLIGVVFGLVAIVWGLATKKAGGRKLAAIGTAGILSTFVLYGSLFYFGFYHRGGTFDQMRADLSRQTITTLAMALEFYRNQNGKYPDSLEELKETLPENSLVFIQDASGISTGIGEVPNYYYSLIDDSHYHLLGRGADGIPFTADDIVPNVEPDQQGQLGLVIDSRSRPAP